MTVSPNQFGMEVVQGQLDLQGFGSNVITCAVSLSEAGTLVAGTSVQLEDSAGGLPKVLKRSADTDPLFGFVVRNLKDSDFVAGSKVEVAIVNSVQYMTASAAIARGASVETVVASDKVATLATSGAPVAGLALDKAAADGDLIRIYVQSPATAAVLP
jgi:hypothetical protein